MLEDIAVLTGGVVISEDKGLKLEQATLEMMGSADKVTVSKDNTTIVNGAGQKENIADRVAQIKKRNRKHQELLRQGEASGAFGQVGRWCSRALRWC